MCHKSVERMRTTVRITRLYRSFHRFGIQDRSSNWEVYIKKKKTKKKKKKRKIWNTNNLTNICTYVFYGVEQVVNLYVNNRHITSKGNNFFFLYRELFALLAQWWINISHSFYFCQTFVEFYLNGKRCLWQIEIIIEGNLIKRKNSFELTKRLLPFIILLEICFFLDEFALIAQELRVLQRTFP